MRGLSANEARCHAVPTVPARPKRAACSPLVAPHRRGWSSLGAVSLLVAVILGVPTGAAGAGATRFAKHKSMSPRLGEARVLGREHPGKQHRIVVSLDLRSRDELESLLADIQNPDSPNYRRFLTPRSSTAATPRAPKQSNGWWTTYKPTASESPSGLATA